MEAFQGSKTRSLVGAGASTRNQPCIYVDDKQYEHKQQEGRAGEVSHVLVE